jgi:hypothetical protein
VIWFRAFRQYVEVEVWDSTVMVRRHPGTLATLRRRHQNIVFFHNRFNYGIRSTRVLCDVGAGSTCAVVVF